MMRILFIAVVAMLALAGGAYGAGKITGAADQGRHDHGRRREEQVAHAGRLQGLRAGAGWSAGSGWSAGERLVRREPTGPQGPPGPSTLSAIKAYYGHMVVSAGDLNGGVVSCPAGQRIVSGGYFADSGIVFLNEATEDQTGWTVAVDNVGSPVDATLVAKVNCAGAGQAVAARARDRRMVPVRDARAARLIAQRRTARG